MTNPNAVPASGDPQDPSVNDPGLNPNPDPVTPPVADPPRNDSVSYESHRKLLGEKKASDARLKAFEDAAKAKELADAERNQNHEQANTLLKDEVTTLREQVEQNKTRDEQAKKYMAFKSAVPGFDEAFVDLVDIDQIQLDQTTGEIDAFSLNKYAETFKTRYAKVLVEAPRNSIPNDAPQGNQGGKISYKQWLDLPSAEMRSRKGDIVD